MNRFEIIAERVAVLGKGMGIREAFYYLKRAMDQVELSSLEHLPIATEQEVYVKKQIEEMMIYLLLIMSKHNYCGACVCGDMEADMESVLKGYAGIEMPDMVVQQPTVVNKNGIPPGVSEGLQSDVQKISERAAGKLNNYRVQCEVLHLGSNGLLASPIDKDQWCTVIKYLGGIQTKSYWDKLLSDLEFCTGYKWYMEIPGGFIALKTDNRIPHSIVLATTLEIDSPNFIRV